jgi:hypothetical protein
MKSKLSTLNLKKGSIVFLYGNWNGNERTTIDFYIQEYKVHSIGNKRCYLLINEDINSKESFNCNYEMNSALTTDQVLEDCSNYVAEYVEAETKRIADQVESAVEYHKNNPNQYKDAHNKYVILMKATTKNLNSAPKRIVVNPYSSKTPSIINL